MQNDDEDQQKLAGVAQTLTRKPAEADAIAQELSPPPFDFEAWRAKLDAYLDIDFPDIEPEPPIEDDEDLSFD